MTKREENKLAMERHLYDVAISMFCELGYQKTTLADIAQEAQVSTRTLYRYFPTKESLLRKFSRENILELKAYAGRLPAGMPIRDKVISVMVKDHEYMFGLFDVSYILHSARDESGVFARFELENVFTTESIYCQLFKQEQLRCGIKPNDAVALCASVVMGLYRHCSDVYRFRVKGRCDDEALRDFYSVHIDVVWDSLYTMLTKGPTKGYAALRTEQRLFCPLSE